jgi:sodium/hydrogen exchanger 10/11
VTLFSGNQVGYPLYEVPTVRYQDVFVSGSIGTTLDVKLILFIYFLKKIGELTEMSGTFTLVIMGLFLNSTNFKPGVEALILE